MNFSPDGTFGKIVYFLKHTWYFFWFSGIVPTPKVLASFFYCTINQSVESINRRGGGTLPRSFVPLASKQFRGPQYYPKDASGYVAKTFVA